MQVIFHPEAENDLARALEHYTKIQPALGKRFYLHIARLVDEITGNPAHFRIWRAPETRRHFRRPFPYALVFAAKPDHLRVFAVMHFKQTPDYWNHRLSN